MRRFEEWITSWLLSPYKVAFVCSLFLFFALTLDGSIFKYWMLNRDQDFANSRISEIRNSIQVTRDQIRMASQPRYMERQARDRLDLVADDEIVFVFADP